MREVIAAMALLRERDKKWHKLKLIMCNSVFDSIESGNEMRALKKLIADYGLQRSVELHDEFMDPDDAMRKLREAEMVIFPYQKTDEGASGAVRFGMASGRMVMTSASRIFDDIADCVIRLDGYDAECFADGIQRYFDNKQDERYGGIRKQCYEWVREHDFRKVAGELEKLIYSLWQEKWFKMHGLNPRLPSIDGKSDFTHR